jgi:hypothetical protein
MLFEPGARESSPTEVDEFGLTVMTFAATTAFSFQISISAMAGLKPLFTKYKSPRLVTSEEPPTNH